MANNIILNENSATIYNFIPYVEAQPISLWRKNITLKQNNAHTRMQTPKQTVTVHCVYCVEYTGK